MDSYHTDIHGGPIDRHLDMSEDKAVDKSHSRVQDEDQHRQVAPVIHTPAEVVLGCDPLSTVDG